MRLIGVDGCPAGWVVAEISLVDARIEVGMEPVDVPSFRIVQTFRRGVSSLVARNSTSPERFPAPGGTTSRRSVLAAIARW